MEMHSTHTATQKAYAPLSSRSRSNHFKSIAVLDSTFETSLNEPSPIASTANHMLSDVPRVAKARPETAS